MFSTTNVLIAVAIIVCILVVFKLWKVDNAQAEKVSKLEADYAIACSMIGRILTVSDIEKGTIIIVMTKIPEVSKETENLWLIKELGRMPCNSWHILKCDGQLPDRHVRCIKRDDKLVPC